MQNHYSLIHREEEREMLPLCQDRNVAVVPWSPLAGGRLTRPWGEQTNRSKIDQVSPMVWGNTEAADKLVVDNLQKLANEKGLPMAQVALAWLLSKPAVTSLIVGTTAVKHVEDAVAALSVKLTDEEIAMLELPYVPHPVLSVF